MSCDASIHIDSSLKYPTKAPFDPDKIYQELDPLGLTGLNSENKVYAAIRKTLEHLGLDSKRMNTSNWNPFSDFIKPGDTVLIKPNLVLHHNRGNENIDAVVTHASVIRPIIDYSLLALNGKGKLIIGDAPHGDADFNSIIRYNGLEELVSWYNEKTKYTIELRDFRKYIYPKGFSDSIFKEVNNDPDGYNLVNLGKLSKLDKLANIERLYGSDYDRKFIVEQHRNNQHKYLIAGTVLNSDVIISVPKLKTHKKTGITINLKNLVGINGDKNYLAHYRVGPPSQGGDEYPDTNSYVLKMLRNLNNFRRDVLLSKNKMSLRYINKLFKIPAYFLNFLHSYFNKIKKIHGGNWYGNDTCWRMCLDLNYILRYADKRGNLGDKVQRKYFCLVDGIIAGEGDGPMTPDPKPIGFLAAGFDPYKVDYVCSYLMGFNPTKLQLIKNSQQDKIIGFLPEDLKVYCYHNAQEIFFRNINLQFLPHYAWQGKIERKEDESS